MKLPGILFRILLGVIALFVGQVIAGALVHIDFGTAQPSLAWLVLSNLLISVAIGAVAMRSGWSGWKLLGALFFVNFGIAALDFVEAVVFLPPTREFWKALFALAIITNGVACLLWMLIFRNRTAVPASAQSALRPRTRFQSGVRFLVADASYVLLYLTAGAIVFPWIHDFYATQHLPPMSQLVPLQLFVRGPVQVSICLVLTIMIHRSSRLSALWVGLVFAVLSSAALLLPNPFLPASVRWAHLVEVGSSSLVFGFVVASLWARMPGGKLTTSPQAAGAAPLSASTR